MDQAVRAAAFAREVVMDDLSADQVRVLKEMARGIIKVLEAEEIADLPRAEHYLREALAEVGRMLGAPTEQCFISALEASSKWKL